MQHSKARNVSNDLLGYIHFGHGCDNTKPPGETKASKGLVTCNRSNIYLCKISSFSRTSFLAVISVTDHSLGEHASPLTESSRKTSLLVLGNRH